MRVLPVIRLSSLDDASTSPERQLDQITHAARARDPGGTILPAVSDLDVSASVPPTERPALAPFLTDPVKIATYDALYVAKLDRIVRSLPDFVDLVRWADRHGKILASVTESIDLSTPHGRLAANILATFAQFERERMAERRREAVITLRKNGWWGGGVAPFGYRPVRDGNHWALVPDPEQAAVIRRMADAILDGTSASAVARILDADGIRPARGDRWSVSSVLALLRSSTLYGQLQDNARRPLRGPDGSPLTLAEAVLDHDLWLRVQTALSATSFKKSGAPAITLLSGIAECACGAKIYANKVTSAPRKDGSRRVYYRYRCAADCGEPQVQQAWLDGEVETMLLAAYASEDIPERIDIPAADHTARLAEVADLIEGLDGEFRAGRLPPAVYARQISALEAERADLESRPAEPARIDWRKTGVLFADRWADLGTPGRNKLLRDLGARVVWGDGLLVANLHTIDDLRRAAAESSVRAN